MSCIENVTYWIPAEKLCTLKVDLAAGRLSNHFQTFDQQVALSPQHVTVEASTNLLVIDACV